HTLNYANNGPLKSYVSNDYYTREKLNGNSSIFTSYSPPTNDVKSSIVPLHVLLSSTSSSISSPSYSLNNGGDNSGIYNIQIDEKTGDKSFYILLQKENSPLGIHVIPYNNNSTTQDPIGGLLLQNIEPDGRIKRQGLLNVNDRIVEINRNNIEKCTFDEAQFIFHDGLSEPELELKIIRNIKKPPPIPPKPGTNSFRLKDETKRKSKSLLPDIKLNHSSNNDSSITTSYTDNESNMNSLNTRKLGRIIKIMLVKGNDGLGFKLASRDNPTDSANPIYVKSIFPKGAAIDDGRLQRGDRLLKVNSTDVTSMSLQDTVGLLRDTRIGETVELIISRQRDGSVPHDLVVDNQNLDNQTQSSLSKTQIFTFDIPLNDTSSAGLGITLKGKTSIVDGQSIDLGIYVKTVLTGGAASRDGRLRPNDQLLIINESSLINTSNLDAAGILHEAVRHEIIPGHIKVTISRSQHEQADDEEDEQDNKKYSYLITNTSKNNNNNYNGSIRETDLPSITSLIVNQPSLSIDIKSDENELDLTTFVPPLPSASHYMKQSQQQQQYKAQVNRSESNKLTEIDNRPSSPRLSSSTATNRSNISPSKNKPNFVQQQLHHHDVPDYRQQHRESKFVSNVSTNEFKTPIVPNNNSQTHDDSDNGTQNNNPFERETPFRQSISEKRRLTHQPNQQALQWKQRSFHEGRQGDRICLMQAASVEILAPVIDDEDDDDVDNEQPMRALPNSPPNGNNSVGGLVRASSLESIHTLTTNGQQIDKNDLKNTDDEYKRQARLRSRACNESFRQAVDKSYHNPLEDESPSESFDRDKSSKDKQRFRFTNLFLRTKKKDKNEKSTSNSNVELLHASRPVEDDRSNHFHYQRNLSPKPPTTSLTPSSNIENQIRPAFPPPPAPFSTRQESTSSASPSKAKASDIIGHDRTTNSSYSISSSENRTPTAFEHQYQQQSSSSNNIISNQNKTTSSGYEPYRFDNQHQLTSQQRAHLVDHFSPPVWSNENSKNATTTTTLHFNPKNGALLSQRDVINQRSQNAAPPPPPVKTKSSSYRKSNNQDGTPYRPVQSVALTLSPTGQKHQQQPALPVQFQSGTQSLRQQSSTHVHHPSIQDFYYNNENQHNVKSSYPSTFTVQPTHFTSYSHNVDQQQQIPKRTHIMSPRHYLHSTTLHENPANV
ncbi:unnamed protein product, partial [Didymodactylos carnosus]